MPNQLTQSPVSPSESAQPNEANLLTQSDPERLQQIRHSCAHILAMAVQNLFPETKVTIGPCTETGFYYDFDRANAFTPADLKKIEKKMRKIIGSN